MYWVHVTKLCVHSPTSLHHSPHTLHSLPPHPYPPSLHRSPHTLTPPPPPLPSFQVKCHHKKVHTGIESIFRCQFHTAVVGEGHRLVYNKSDLDDAFKDKRFGENIKVELLFESFADHITGELQKFVLSTVRSVLLHPLSHLPAWSSGACMYMLKCTYRIPGVVHMYMDCHNLVL